MNSLLCYELASLNLPCLTVKLHQGGPHFVYAAAKIVGQIDTGSGFGPIRFQPEFLAQYPSLAQVELLHVRGQGLGFVPVAQRYKNTMAPRLLSSRLISPEVLAQLRASYWYDAAFLSLPRLSCQRVVRSHHEFYLVRISAQDAQEASRRAQSYVATIVGMLEGPSNRGRILFSAPFIKAYPQLKEVTVVRDGPKRYLYAEVPLSDSCYEDKRREVNINKGSTPPSKQQAYGLGFAEVDVPLAELSTDNQEVLALEHLPLYEGDEFPEDEVWQFKNALVTSGEHFMKLVAERNDELDDSESASWQYLDIENSNYEHEVAVDPEDSQFYVSSMLSETGQNKLKMRLSSLFDDRDDLNLAPQFWPELDLTTDKGAELLFVLGRETGILPRLERIVGKHTALFLFDWALEALLSPVTGRRSLQDLLLGNDCPLGSAFFSHISTGSYQESELIKRLSTITPEMLAAWHDDKAQDFGLILAPEGKLIGSGHYKVQLTLSSAKSLYPGTSLLINNSILFLKSVLPSALAALNLTWYVPCPWGRVDLNQAAQTRYEAWLNEVLSGQTKFIVQVPPEHPLHTQVLSPEIRTQLEAKRARCKSLVAKASGQFASWRRRQEGGPLLGTIGGPQLVQTKCQLKLPASPVHTAYVLCDHSLRLTLRDWYDYLIARLPSRNQDELLLKELKHAHILTKAQEPDGCSFKVDREALDELVYRHSCVVLLSNDAQLSSSALKNYYAQGRIAGLTALLVGRWGKIQGQPGFALLAGLVKSLLLALHERQTAARKHEFGQDMLSLQRYLRDEMSLLELMSDSRRKKVLTRQGVIEVERVRSYLMVLLGLKGQGKCQDFRLFHHK